MSNNMGEQKEKYGWICTNCGAKYGPPPYLIHSSWGCQKCSPLIRKAIEEKERKKRSPIKYTLE